jgi:TM2 domain-containing membrane protein YozV
LTPAIDKKLTLLAVSSSSQPHKNLKHHRSSVVMMLRRTKMREPLLAGILSLLVPGLGQIYNGRVLVGILWLVLTGFSWIGSAGTLGWIVHLIAAWCAYSYAKEHPIR